MASVLLLDTLKTVDELTSIDITDIPKKSGSTIAGVWSFSTSPIVPTATAGDNTTKAASTAFVTAAVGAIPVIPDASTSAKGKVQLATTAEVQAGTDALKAVTPAGLKAGLNATGTAPIYACRAWVNFNGTDTVAISASGNVSSITDNGTGNYTINFTTSMPDANYSAVFETAKNGAYVDGHDITLNSGNCTVTYFAQTGAYIDSPIVCASIFR